MAAAASTVSDCVASCVHGQPNTALMSKQEKEEASAEKNMCICECVKSAFEAGSPNNHAWPAFLRCDQLAGSHSRLWL